MAAQSFKERVTQTAISQAKVYEKVFLKYEYLLCSKAFHNQSYYIISAHADNYRHLVGVNTAISADDFFAKCINGTLTEEDFDFNKKGQPEKEVKGAVRDKLIALPQFLTMMEKPLLAEEEFVKNRVHCIFATTDQSATVGFATADRSKPMTLLRGDRLNPLKSAPVDLILRRQTGAELFDEIVCGDETMVAKYMGGIQKILSDDLKPQKAYSTV